jgi:hypothetical protein
VVVGWSPQFDSPNPKKKCGAHKQQAPAPSSGTRVGGGSKNKGGGVGAFKPNRRPYFGAYCVCSNEEAAI